MARYWFGGGIGDFTVGRNAAGNLILASGTLTLWDAQAGGNQLTDLLLGGTAATSTVTTSATGQIPRFQGPNGVTQMWIDGGSGRALISSPDAVSAPGTPGIGVPAGGTTGQVLVKTSGADNATAWADPATGTVPTATTTTAGKVVFASTYDGTDTTKAVTGATVAAALSGISAVTNIYVWRYTGGAYPTAPATQPAGVTRLEAIGPVQPSSFPSWCGTTPDKVPAGYTWAPLT